MRDDDEERADDHDDDQSRPRDVLAENLRKLMAATPSLNTFSQITKAGGGSNGTLDRIRRRTTSTSIDNLEPLARVFGIEPWQLLVPNLMVSTGPDGMPLLHTVEWPFPAVNPARFYALPEADRGYVQRRLMQAIADCDVQSVPLDAPAPGSIASQHQGKHGNEPPQTNPKSKRA
jgi:hypothetical protein